LLILLFFQGVQKFHNFAIIELIEIPRTPFH
jgi:hypothetical protein